MTSSSTAGGAAAGGTTTGGTTAGGAKTGVPSGSSAGGAGAESGAVAQPGAGARLRPRRRAGVPARAGGLLVLPPLLVVAVFVGIPVVSGVLYTLGHFGGLNSVVASIGLHQYAADHWWGTLAAYRTVLTSDSFLRSLVVTVEVTVSSVVVVFALALAVALYARLHGGRVARLVTALAVTPLFLPAVIGSYAILTFYAGDGALTTLAHTLGWGSAPRLSYTTWGVIVGQVWTNLPFAVLMLTSGLAAVPDALIEAARDAGAGPAQVVLRILLPMTKVPAVITATFTSIAVLGSFTVPYLVGPTAPTMLGVQLANAFQSFNQPQQSLVIAVVVFALASVVGVAYVRSNVRQARDAARGGTQ
ncbi:ABC-type transporter, integral membrane subunit [Actinobacteria bacterium OK074]|nr:ABC-type transporter, integral membrane subunit [Actinobacteria bacterium OK074]